MVSMLGSVIDYGTGKGARLDRPAAGKTGTSSDFHDAWFLGFTSDYTTGVWIGNDDSSPMHKITGGSLPVQVWRGVMNDAEHGKPQGSPVAFERSAASRSGRRHEYRYDRWAGPIRSAGQRGARGRHPRRCAQRRFGRRVHAPDQWAVALIRPLACECSCPYRFDGLPQQPSAARARVHALCACVCSHEPAPDAARQPIMTRVC